MPIFMKDGPVSCLTIWITAYEDVGTTHRLLNAGKEQIYTYVEAVNFILKSYTTDSNIVTVASKIAALSTALMETSVQFADVLCTKVVRCGDAYPEECTIEVFLMTY